MFVPNLIGFMVGLYYVLSTIRYSKSEKEQNMVIYLTLLGSFVTLILSMGAFLSAPDFKTGQFLLGTLAVITVAALNASTFVTLPKVFKTKDTSSISLPISFGLFFMGVIWGAYGILLRDPVCTF